MLSKEEMRVFLALLAGFCSATALSAAAQAELLGISHPTMARWVSAARAEATGAGPYIRAYHHSVAPVAGRINYLNQVDAASGLYASIKRAAQQVKLDTLLAALGTQPV